MDVILRAEHVLAMAHLRGEDDIRPWANAVWIEAQPRTLLWATTGTVLGVYDTQELASERFTVRIPRPVLSGMKRFSGPVRISSDDGKHWRADNLGTVQHWVDDGVVMPDLRRVLPVQTSGIAQSFDLDLLTRFQKVRDLLVKGARKERKKDAALFNHVLIAHNGGKAAGPAIVTISNVPEFFGVAMPLNDAALEVANMRRSRPDWVVANYFADDAPAVPAECADLL